MRAMQSGTPPECSRDVERTGTDRNGPRNGAERRQLQRTDICGIASAACGGKSQVSQVVFNLSD